VTMPASPPPHRIVVDQRELSRGELVRVADEPAISFVQGPGPGKRTERWSPDGFIFTVPEWDSRLLGMEAGTKLVRNTRTVCVGDEPVLTSAALVLPELLGGAVRWREEPIGELALAGVSVTFSRAEVYIRIPTLLESEPLGIEGCVPVCVIYRRCQVTPNAGGPPVPACVLVIARGDRVHL
jgi:hypothetical protein